MMLRRPSGGPMMLRVVRLGAASFSIHVAAPSLPANLKNVINFLRDSNQAPCGYRPVAVVGVCCFPRGPKKRDPR